MLHVRIQPSEIDCDQTIDLFRIKQLIWSSVGFHTELKVASLT